MLEFAGQSISFADGIDAPRVVNPPGNQRRSGVLLPHERFSFCQGVAS